MNFLVATKIEDFLPRDVEGDCPKSWHLYTRLAMPQAETQLANNETFILPEDRIVMKVRNAGVMKVTVKTKTGFDRFGPFDALFVSHINAAARGALIYINPEMDLIWTFRLLADPNQHTHKRVLYDETQWFYPESTFRMFIPSNGSSDDDGGTTPHP